MMTATSAPVNFSRSGPYLVVLFGIAIIAFWPTYLSRQAPPSSGFTHVHAFTATVWMLLLIAQPIAIRRRRLALHRTLGRVSYVVAPLVVGSVLLLAHSRIRGAQPDAYAIQTYILYLQLSLAFLFTVFFAMAVVYRRVAAVHARFMIGTALTLIDPIVIRLMFSIAPIPAWNYQWLTFGVTDLVLVVLIWLERRSRTARWVFPSMLLLFVASQTPALLGLTDGAPWQTFAKWFAAL